MISRFLTYLAAFFFLTLIPCYSQETVSSLGIFDATADWGLEPDFPHQIGKYKVPGKVEISQTDDGFVYDLYGNGNEIWFSKDEGFFLYAEKSGSWSLSGKLRWCSPGGGDMWAKFALMIRDKGKAPDSKYYAIILCSGMSEPYGDLLAAQWRKDQGGLTESLTKNTTTNWSSVFLPYPGVGVYFRITRIAPENLLFSEWSHDGVTWNLLHWIRIEMDKTVAYGIALNNHAENELLSHAKATNVSLNPAPPLAQRQFTEKWYTPRQPVKVTLTLTNPSERIERVSIVEKLPRGWTAKRIIPDGIMEKGKIVWHQTMEPGSTVLTYEAYPPEGSSEVAMFVGKVNSQRILGETELSPSLQNSGYPPSGHWRYWTSSDGLVRPTCYRVMVRSNGSVWAIHSIQGLTMHYPQDQISQLDGYNVRIIENAVRNTPLYENQDGQIWSLYFEESQIRGLQRYEPSSNEWVRYEIEEMFSTQIPTGVPDRLHVALLPTDNDRVIFLLPDRLMEFNTTFEKTKLILDVSGTNLERFKDMCSARDGGLWITGSNGLAKLNGKIQSTSMFSEYTEYLFEKDYGIHNLMYPFEDEEGNIWGVANALGNPRDILVHFDGERWKMLFVYQGFPVYKRMMGFPDINGSFWIVDSSSLSRIEDFKQEFVPKNELLTDSIKDMVMEPNNVLWLATSQGLARHAPVPWRIPPEVSDLDRICHSIIEDRQGRIWFACVDTLVCFHSGKWKYYTLPTDPFSFDTNSLCLLPDGRIALRNISDSLLTFNPQEERFEWIVLPTSHFIGLIAPRRNGGILFESYSLSSARIEAYDGKQFQTILEFNLRWDTGYTRYLLEDTQGAIWIGGEDYYGLARYQNGKYQVFGQKENYPGGAVYSILEVEKKTIWFGCQDSILEYSDNNFTVVRSGFGIVRSMIKSRDSSIWVASQTGLHRFHNGSWVTNTYEDGLPARDIFDVFEDSQSNIWIGTNRGICQYDPEADSDPPIAFIDSINPKEIPPKGEAQFSFSGMDKWKYTKKDRLLFSYRIDAGNWSPYVSESVALVTGLKPGGHVLELCTMDRNWNVSEPVSWNFTVLVPWYREPYFLLLMTITIMVIVVLLSLHISNYFNLAKLVTDRTKHLLDYQQKLKVMTSELSLAEERERRRLASDLHDSVSQSLSLSIMELSDVDDAETVEEIKEQVAGIGQRLEETLVATQSMTFELCPPELYQIGLETAVQEMLAQMRKQHGIEFVLKDDQQPRELSEDLRYFLFRSIRELLINIMKHANAKHAWVKLNSSDNTFTIQVIDDGVGFDMTRMRHDSKQQGGFGLFSIQERLMQMEGSFKIESKPNEGAIVTITVPLKKTE